MRLSKILLTGVAVLALGACGKKDADSAAPQTQSSQKAAKTTAASPLDAEFRLKGAEEIDIDALFALMPEGKRPTYEAATFDKRLGATIVDNLRFSDKADGQGVLVERAEFYGVDMEAISSVKSAENVTATSPFETVFQKVRFLNIQTEGFESEDSELHIGGIEFDNLAIRQGGVDGDGNGEEGSRFFNAVNLAGVYFKDISVTGTPSEAPAVEFSAPDLRFVGLGGGKLSAVIANDLEYKMIQSEQSLAAMRKAFGPQGAMLLSGPLQGLLLPENQLTLLKTFEWRDIDLSGLLAWGLKGEEPPMSEHDLIDLGTMKVTDVESYINKKRAAVISEATITAANFTWLVPSLIRTETKGAVYDLTAYVTDEDEATLKVLLDNGLDKVKADGDAEWKWDAKSGIAGLDYVATSDGFLDFNMEMDFSELKLKELQKAKDDGEENPVQALGKFNSFSLRLDDEQALDTIFGLAALQMGGTADDLRQSAPAMIRLSGIQAAQLNPRFSGYVDALADFVAKGGSLEISANPSKPVAFSAFEATSAAPQTLPDVIDLKVTHEE